MSRQGCAYCDDDTRFSVWHLARTTSLSLCVTWHSARVDGVVQAKPTRSLLRAAVHRLGKGAAPATINREAEAIGRAFALAVESGLLRPQGAQPP
jgi:hypothetical protein